MIGVFLRHRILVPILVKYRYTPVYLYLSMRGLDIIKDDHEFSKTKLV